MQVMVIIWMSCDYFDSETDDSYPDIDITHNNKWRGSYCLCEPSTGYIQKHTKVPRSIRI